MADIQRVVEILFNATDNTSSALNSISGSFGKLEQSLAPLGKAQDTLVDLETKALGVSLALGGLAIFEAGNFNASIAEIGTLFNATAGEVDALAGQVKEFASGSSSGIGEVTDALYNYISATGDTKASVEALADIEKLGIAGKADLNTATGAVTTVMNAYGLKMEDISDISDVFFTTVQNGTTTLPELGSNIGQVAASAAAAGVGFDVVGSAIAALTGAIGNTSQSTTQFKALLTELAKPSDELRKVLGPLADEAGRLPEKLELIQNATGGTQSEMVKLFGSVEASSAALILANDSAGTFNNTLLAMEDRAGATATAYQAMEGQFGNVNQRLLNATRTTLISVGDNLIGGYTEVASALTEIFQAFTPAIDAGAFDQIFNYLDIRAGDLAELFSAIAENLPAALEDIDFSRLVGSFEDLLGAVEGLFAELFGNVDLRTVEGLQEALQNVVNLFALLNETVAAVATQWQPIFGVIGDFIRGAGDVDGATTNNIGSFIALGKQVGIAAGVLGGLTGALGVAADAMVLLSGAKALGASTTALAGFAASAGTAAASLGAVGLAGAAGFALGNLLGLDEVGKDLGGWLYDLLNPTEQAAKNLDGLGESASNVADTTGAVADNVENLADSASSLKDAAGEGAEAAGEMADAIREIEELASEEGTAKWIENTRTELSQLNYDFVANRKELKAYGETTEEVIGSIQRNISAWEDARFALGETDALTETLNYTLVDQIKTGLLQEKITKEQAIAFYELAGATGEVEKLTEKTATKTLKLADEQKKLALASEEARLKLLEIASDERIALIESQFELNVAQVEADAEKISAAFESIGNTVTSTGETLSSLFDLLGSGDLSRLQELELESVIREENERRREAFELEKQLTEAQIKNMELRNQQLQEGGALIEIDGAGLQPHLESFMFEILETIQVRVNQEGYDLLVGG